MRLRFVLEDRDLFQPGSLEYIQNYLQLMIRHIAIPAPLGVMKIHCRAYEGFQVLHEQPYRHIRLLYHVVSEFLFIEVGCFNPSPQCIPLHPSNQQRKLLHVVGGVTSSGWSRDDTGSKLFDHSAQRPWAWRQRQNCMSSMCRTRNRIQD